MKSRLRQLPAFLIGLLLTLFTWKNAAAQGASFQLFYDQLAPYGRWVAEPQFGYVWVPDAGPDFRPYYTAGRWAYSPYGAMWVSDYPWGWAPFHYGRWSFDPFYGWFWVPDTVWGPAWVSWRTGGGNFGWAPMSPGISIRIALSPSYHCPHDWWVFVPRKHILNPSFHRYYRGPSHNPVYISNTTVINNTYIENNRTYVSGPSVNAVQQGIGRPVTVHQVHETTAPGQTQLSGKQISIYKPRVNAAGSGAKAAPREVVRTGRAVGKPQSLQAGNAERFDPKKAKPEPLQTGQNQRIQQPTRSAPSAAPVRPYQEKQQRQQRTPYNIRQSDQRDLSAPEPRNQEIRRTIEGRERIQSTPQRKTESVAPQPRQSTEIRGSDPSRLQQAPVNAPRREELSRPVTPQRQQMIEHRAAPAQRQQQNTARPR